MHGAKSYKSYGCNCNFSLLKIQLCEKQKEITKRTINQDKSDLIKLYFL